MACVSEPNDSSSSSSSIRPTFSVGPGQKETKTKCLISNAMQTIDIYWTFHAVIHSYTTRIINILHFYSQFKALSQPEHQNGPLGKVDDHE